MMRRPLFALLLLCSTALPTLAEKRVALVMAGDDYKLIRPLDNAVNDAQAIEESLEALGFEVFLETDRDLRRMRRALEDFREDAAGADVALIFFAGHGVELAGENRLLPIDADATSLETLKGSSLPLEEVRQTVASIAKVGLIVLDACRNDPFGGGDGSGRGAKALNVAETPEIKPGFGRLGKAENLLYTFSAAPGATAADGSGDNSPFTAALVKYLGTDGLEIRSVLTLVQQEVYDLSRGTQLPYVENGLPQLFFASTTAGDLPERERLLLAMADVTPDLRAEVERLAADNDMPLAPLYAALISSDAGELSSNDRIRKLNDAAGAFVTTRAQIRTLSSADPAVARLREEAEAQLSLGAFETARGKLSDAAAIDSASRDTLKANFLNRTLSEATTHTISGGASRAELNYALAIDSYRKATALYDEVGGETLPDEDHQRRIEALDTVGDLYLTVGNLAEARTAFEGEQAIAAALAAAAPANAVWRQKLANSRLKLGDVARDQGDSPNALASYQAGLAATGDSTDTGGQGLAAAAHLKIGAIQKIQGDFDRALESYRASRDIAARLAAAEPGNNEWQATLATSHRLVGEVEESRGKYAEALSSYEAGLAIAETLAAARPGDALRQFDVAAAHDGVGYAQYRLKDEAGSKLSFEQSLAITRQLIAADPKNLAWQRALAGTLEKLGEATYFGDNVITRQDADQSLAAYEEAGAIRERLVAADVANKVWVSDLVKSYEKRATWHAFVPDDVKALEFTKKAHGASLDLAALDPQNMEWQRKATLYHAKIAESYIQLKDYPNALAYEQAGLAYAQKVAAGSPDKQPYRSDIVTFHDRIARVYWIQQDYKSYFAENDLRLAAAQEGVKAFPEDTNSLRDLAAAYVDVGKTYTQNFPDDALALFEAARTNAEKAAGIDPASAEFQTAVANANLQIAYLHEQQGRIALARTAYEAALAATDRALSLKPGDTANAGTREHILARAANLPG